MRKEVPLGVVYGEKIDVPKGPARKQFLKEHDDYNRYAFFTDKEGLERWNYKRGYEGEGRLHDYKSSDVNRHFFGDTWLSDTDNLSYKEFKVLPLSEDERYKFFSNPDRKYLQMTFFDDRQRPLGKFMDIAFHPPAGANTYHFERGKVDSEEKLYYEDDSDVPGAVPVAGSVFGGRRKRKTNRKKNKNRRTKSRRHRRS